jgi:hypothetical protein
MDHLDYISTISVKGTRVYSRDIQLIIKILTEFLSFVSSKGYSIIFFRFSAPSKEIIEYKKYITVESIRNYIICFDDVSQIVVLFSLLMDIPSINHKSYDIIICERHLLDLIDLNKNVKNIFKNVNNNVFIDDNFNAIIGAVQPLDYEFYICGKELLTEIFNEFKEKNNQYVEYL